MWENKTIYETKKVQESYNESQTSVHQHWQILNLSGQLNIQPFEQKEPGFYYQYTSDHALSKPY